jgi:hypothetical protein
MFKEGSMAPDQDPMAFCVVTTTTFLNDILKPPRALTAVSVSEVRLPSPVPQEA